MPAEPATYVLRGSNVTHERLDDEVIAIDLDRGFYFAMVGPAADIWTAMVDGGDTGVTAALLARRYGVDVTVAEAAVGEFVTRLVEEDLLVPRAPGTPHDDPVVPVLPDLPGPVPWSTPELERYDDMADLVLLDPIHQVDESGWPHLPPES